MPSLDTAMSYHRLMRNPLDDREVFTSLRDLMDYCDNGARYNGQRVVVIDNQTVTEYVINDNIPIIDMKGNEPIFKSITFSGDSSASHGLLIYENNLGGTWDKTDTFTFNDGKLSLFKQLEIFRILDASGNKSYKFYMERLTRNTDTLFTRAWNQNYNPYIDGSSHSISGASSGAAINEMSYNSTTTGWAKCSNSDIILMPVNNTALNKENSYITRIYVKAENYYQALV